MSFQQSGEKAGTTEFAESNEANQEIHSPSSHEDGGAQCCQLLNRIQRPGSNQQCDGSLELLKKDKNSAKSYGGHFSKSCHLQFYDTPLKISRAYQQYIYDEMGTEYLDCVNSVAHVGHSHPAIVEAVSFALGSLDRANYWFLDNRELLYPSRLKETLPDGFDTFLFCNSGSEAVDLSIQLARLYTKGTDAIVVDNSFHGAIDSVCPLSRKVSKEVSDWVHVLSLPDLYRGTYQGKDPEAVNKYLVDAQKLLEKTQSDGRKIACFIAEPTLSIPGVIFPPNGWLPEIYKMVRENGGLCIADEVQTGLGRIGTHFWSFQAENVIPDILVLGKPLGNGYPMAAVATTRDIATVLGDRVNEYRCTTAMDAVGVVVLDIIQQNQLMTSAANIGHFLKEQLNILKMKQKYIGDVRGKGLLFGIEIVWSKKCKKPSRAIAEQIIYRMKEENVILANEGKNRNILMLIPPMCFSQENALVFVQKLDKILTELPTISLVEDIVTGLPTPSIQPGTGKRDVQLGIRQPQEEEDDDDSASAAQDAMDLEYVQHCYQDLD